MVIVLCASFMRVPFVYAYYYLDTSDFIERLCENREKPELQCNGQCFLSKMLQEDSKEEAPPLPDVTWSRLDFLPEFTENTSFTSLPEGTVSYPYRNALYLYLPVLFQFRPPPPLLNQ